MNATRLVARAQACDYATRQVVGSIPIGVFWTPEVESSGKSLHFWTRLPIAGGFMLDTPLSWNNS